MINWVWCTDCLDWKDAGNEVSFVCIEEDSIGNDRMTFICDKCEKENTNSLVPSVIKPRSFKRIVTSTVLGVVGNAKRTINDKSVVPLTIEDALDRQKKENKYS